MSSFIFSPCIDMSVSSEIISGRKRTKNKQAWARNIAESLRDKGLECESIKTGKNVLAKPFTDMETCCPRQCFSDIDCEWQKSKFNKFWECGNFEVQNTISENMMEKKESTPELERSKLQFLCRYKGSSVHICREFICNLFQIGERRITTVQNKIVNEKSMRDGRRKHVINRHYKLTEEVKTLILQHCQSLPHTESHYNRKHSKLNYFADTSLTLSSLYYSFLDFYASVTGCEIIPIESNTYFDYFNHNVNFSIGLPRTDVCDLCFTYETNKGRKEEYMQHIVQIEKYKHLKKNMMATADALKIEFDFGQNLPLPKLPVNAQFFRRLIWLYIFNVHVFDSDRSYMFHFLEGVLKKGANSVCNMVEYAITKELELNYFNKIFGFSDAAGGQIRHYTTLQCFSYLSCNLQIEIHHLFPVRGHSYCQCDRNFGLYGTKKKKAEGIETESDYVQLIKDSRDSPFDMIDVSKLKMYDYEKLFGKAEDLKRNEVKISKAVKIVYFPTGTIDLYYNYDDTPTTIRLPSSIGVNLSEASLTTKVGITKEKEKDFKHLLQFCTAKRQSFGEDFLNRTTIKTDRKKIEKVESEIESTKKYQVYDKQQLKSAVKSNAKPKPGVKSRAKGTKKTILKCDLPKTKKKTKSKQAKPNEASTKGKKPR